jgi:peptide/nickel transport system permease protein
MTTASKNIPVVAQTQATSKSQWQVVWEQFRKHQLAMLGGFILLVMYVGALFAPFIAPYGLTEYSTSDIKKYHPPTQVRIIDPQSGQLTWPFVYATTNGMDPDTFQSIYTEDTAQKCPVKFFINRNDVEDGRYSLLGFIPGSVHLFGVDAPCKIFLAGSDSYGRDLFSRIWYGAQISLTIGIVSIIVAFGLGITLGGIAGYYGGVIDNVIMRLTEVLAAIPDLFLLITLTALLPRGLNPLLVFYGIVFMLGFIGWGGVARVIRAQILSLREVDYVQAANALGASESRIIFRHILPNAASYLIVSLSLAIPGYILLESGLSFIGQGIREPYSSWGLLLSDVTQGGFASFTDRPWVLIPGAFIVVAILCWNFLGDGMRDAFDPKKRQ